MRSTRSRATKSHLTKEIVRKEEKGNVPPSEKKMEMSLSPDTRDTLGGHPYRVARNKKGTKKGTNKNTPKKTTAATFIPKRKIMRGHVSTGSFGSPSIQSGHSISST